MDNSAIILFGSFSKLVENASLQNSSKMNNKKRLEFNEDLLKDIANETGGQYFHALDREGLEKIYTSINQLEKSTIEVTSYNRFSEEYLPWLIAAFALLLLEIILRYTVFKKFP